MRRGAPRGSPQERARATRPLAPGTEEEELEDLTAALAASLRLVPLTPAAAEAAPAASTSEGDWVLVEEPAAEPPPEAVATLLPLGCVRVEDLVSAAQGLAELRIYLVWSIRTDTALAGVHLSTGTAAYNGLLTAAGQEWSALRWTRHRGPLAAAPSAWLSQGRRMGLELRFYRWQ